MKSLPVLASLRALVDQMEVDLGLAKESRAEIDIILAIASVQSQFGSASVEQILKSPLARKLSRPTVFRITNQLVAKGHIYVEGTLPHRRYATKK